ncbi:OprO/OprP family phosphate-selective porin [Botrimarina hoheduenensis]|uniref:Phosphate-selective porin O and P n=1 Tax=Botrimarina hoheduenensis TaxID=2528000 RepID=A0A5C5W8E6_9BACT|nr:porin [Botrimarina hoheduenensis]TWT46455.1 Phosphate-selective porin O and P [Botrimarina hoheduenensis]
MKLLRHPCVVASLAVAFACGLGAVAPAGAEEVPSLLSGDNLPRETKEASLEALIDRIEQLEATQDELLADRKSLEEQLAHRVATGHDGATMELSGRIHADLWTFPGDSPGVNGFESGDPTVSPQDEIGIRRARLTFQGDVADNMLYKLDLEIVGSNHPEFRDAYLGWRDLPLLQTLHVGNQKRPYGLDHINSSRYNVFMERPMVVEAFNPGNRRLGIQSYGVSDDQVWNWRYGAFNQGLIQDEYAYVSDNWQPQLAGRLAKTAWWHEPTNGRGYAHLALAGSWADTDQNAPVDNYAGSGRNEARFATRPEARSSASWIDTGVIADAEHYTLLASEGVLNFGALQLVAEQQNLFIERARGESLYLHGAYAYLSYFLTGEYIPWDRETGQIGRAIPNESFFAVERRCDVERGWGAWQVACRWSYADLADQDIQGGDAEAITLSLNWYWNAYAKLQTEYTWGQIEANDLNAAPAGPNAGDYQILGTRFVIDF